MHDIKPRLVSLFDLYDQAEVEEDYIVESVLIRGGLGLLAGKPKAGKSTLARGLALSVASGTPFLGFPTQQGAVLYYGLEEKDSEIKRHFMEMGATGTEKIVVSTRALPGTVLDTFKRDISMCKPALVIVDPLFRVVRAKDTNSYAEMTNALAPYLEIARETQVHILFVHHQGKGGHKGADAILGSTAIRGAVDVSIMLNKSEHHRTIEIEGRYANSMPESVIEYDSASRTYSLGAKKAEVDGERVGKEVLLLLGGANRGLTREQIETGIEARTEWLRYALRKLLQEGRVVREGTGTRGAPFIYFNSCSLVPSP